MKSFWLFVGFAVWAPSGSSQPAAARDLRIEPIPIQRRVALVIGNAAYQQAPLANPVNDARAVSALLRRLGFVVTEAHNAGKRQMRELADQFAAGLRPGDLAWFYFAGHGMQVRQENYLIPVDFQAASEADVPYEAYSAEQLRDKMEASGARLRLLVLDACRNNPFRGVRSAGGGLAAMRSDAEGTLIAFATGDGNVADDNRGEGNGLFTRYLIQELAAPGVSIEEAFKRVKEQVYLASGKRQNPFTYDNVVGRYYLQLEPLPTATAAAVPAPAASPPAADAPSAAVSEEGLRDRLMALGARAAAVRASLQRLREEQARQGVGLRADIAAAAHRLEYALDEAESALRDARIPRAAQQMAQAERELDRLELFLGR